MAKANGFRPPSGAGGNSRYGRLLRQVPLIIVVLGFVWIVRSFYLLEEEEYGDVMFLDMFKYSGPPVNNDGFEIMSDEILPPYPDPGRAYVHLNGFQVCSMLNNATFYADVDLHYAGLPPITANNGLDLVQYIDEGVLQIEADPWWQENYQRRTQWTKDFESDMLRRGICFQVALGNSRGWKPYAYRTALRGLDPEAAFPFMNFRPRSGTVSGRKPAYKIAYAIIIHQDASNVFKLIDALDDPSVFMLIHMDRHSDQEFQYQVRLGLFGRPNIKICDTQFTVRWAHVSIVWTQLYMFFELLDLVEFEYLMNLSGADYPIKSAQTMYQTIERKPKHNWMYWVEDSSESTQVDFRLQWMWHCRPDIVPYDEKLCNFSHPIEGQRDWVLNEIFPYRHKSSQWIILYRETIEYLRESESARLLLLHNEHAFAPDESFFSIFLASSPYCNRTLRDAKRMTWWVKGHWHPETWSMKDVRRLKKYSDPFFFVRKVDLIRTPGIQQVLDDIRALDRMDETLVHKYRPETGIVPVLPE